MPYQGSLEGCAMKLSICVVQGKQSASSKIAGWMLTTTLLWLMPAVANTPAYGQTSDDASNSSAATSSPADWTQFLRDNMQRWNPYETVLGVNNVGDLQVKWKNATILSYSSPPPAVVNGVLYFGSDSNTVWALNASTGATLWTYLVGDEVMLPVAVAKGVVYFVSYRGGVYALNASTGALLWNTRIGLPTQYEKASSPTVVNGVVYVGASDGNVYALNASTGASLWTRHIGNNVFSTPAVVNGVVYVGSDNGGLYALSASTGVILSWYFTRDKITSSPVVANGVVYLGSFDRNVYALNADTGAKLWSYTTSGAVESTAAVANGVVYVCSDDHFLYALNSSTGVLLWYYYLGTYVGTSPAVANGVVYITALNGSNVGNVYALNAGNGAPLWSYNLGPFGQGAGPGSIAAPTIVDGVLYIRAARGAAATSNTYAFSLPSADLFLRILPSTTTVHQGDLLTFAFPVWNLGPNNADLEVLNTQVPVGTTFDYIRISGTRGLGTCTTPPYQGSGQIVCHENAAMTPNTTWTVRLTVKVTAPAGSVIRESAATMSDTPDPNMANNMASVSLKVQ